MCWLFTRACHAGLMWAQRFSFLRSLVQLGASVNDKNTAQKTIAFVSLLPAVVSRTYEAYGIWHQIGKKLNVFCLKIFSCKRSSWKFVVIDVLSKNQPIRDLQSSPDFQEPMQLFKVCCVDISCCSKMLATNQRAFLISYSQWTNHKSLRALPFFIYFSNQLKFSKSKGA